MKVYTIIGGVNGVGKSSLTGVLRTQLRDLGRIIDVDELTARGGLSPLEGGKEALRRIRQCLDKGVCFTQESTLSGFRTEKTAAEALERGYAIRLFYVGLDSPEECLERIETASATAATASRSRTCSAASPPAGTRWAGSSPTARRRTSSTTTTASRRWRSTATGNCC